MQYPILIYPCPEGGFVAEVPALKGCLAQGETVEEVFQELEIVTRLWIESAQRNGQTLPSPELAIAQAQQLSA
ncbi:MAG: type II toxin-antitoxin system HicB family antitoxin [Chloroflexaceae bacterium]|nr:type II toxin-antitoxin system HicB family antitoxin [Chloroflexaceae bacterium]